MQSIRQIQQLNARELEANISPAASWHTDYRDTAYIYIGGLPLQLSEGDILTIFSQYGTPTYINLIRDRETGKSKGFAFLKYEDQRSTDLAVDNLGGAVVMDRTLKVDHTRYKKKNEDEPDEGLDLTGENRVQAEGEDVQDEVVQERPVLREERELARLIEDHDDEDPMKAFLIDEKKAEVSKALARLNDGKDEKSHTSKHRHHRSHRHREVDDDSRHRHGSRRDDRHDSRSHRDEKESRYRSSRYEHESESKVRDRDSRGDRSDDEDRHRSRRTRDSGHEADMRTKSREDESRGHKYRSEDRTRDREHSDRYSRRDDR